MLRLTLTITSLALLVLALACASEEDRFLEEVATWHVRWELDDGRNTLEMVCELEGMQTPAMHHDTLEDFQIYRLAHRAMIDGMSARGGGASPLVLLSFIRLDAEKDMLKGHFSKADEERMATERREAIEKRLKYLRGE